jgi:hypothetical protein
MEEIYDEKDDPACQNKSVMFLNSCHSRINRYRISKLLIPKHDKIMRISSAKY